MAQSSWEIMPYAGHTPFKRVRVYDRARVEQVVHHLRAHDYVMVLGPPYSEKTRLLHDVRRRLHETPGFQPVYVNLWQAVSDDEATFFTSLARLMSQADSVRFGAPGEPLTNARDFLRFLQAALRVQAQHIVLLLDHLHWLPQDLVHSLLAALRSLYMERRESAVHRLGAAVAGGVNLAGLASGPTSPFNIARQVLVTPLDVEQSHALARATLEAYGRQASQNALDLLVEWVGRDAYLLPLLCGWCAEQVAGYQRPQVTSTVVERAVQRLWRSDEGQAPVREAIHIIEEDADSLLDVLDVLDSGELPRNRARQAVTRTGVDHLQLCGALVLENRRYQVKNRAYVHLLADHFTPERVGHVLRMAGRWREAIAHLTSRLGVTALGQARHHLLEAVVQSIYATDDLDDAYSKLVQGLEQGFGLSDVHVYRADPAHSQLRLVHPFSLNGTQAPTIIAMDQADSVESQTFRYGEYALRRSDDQMRLVAALVPERRPIGVVTVGRYAADIDRRGVPAELPDVLRFLRHAAGAIENVLLRSAYQRIGRIVLDAGALQPGVNQVLRVVCEALGCDFATLYLVNAGAARVEMVAGVGEPWSPEWQTMARFPQDGGHPAARCLNELDVIATYGADHRLDPAITERFGLQRYLRAFVPLVAAGSTLGTLEVAYHKGRKSVLTQEDRRNLLVFADQVAIAVHNMQLLRRTDEALARRVDEMEKLRSAGLTVSATLDVEVVLARIIADVRSLLPGTQTTVWQYRTDDRSLTVLQSSLDDAAHLNARLDLDSFTGQAVSTRQPRTVADIRARPELFGRSRIWQLGLRGIIAVPLVSHGRVLGAIVVYTSTPYQFSTAEVELLQAFAAQAAIALHNAQQYAELEAARRQLENMREQELLELTHVLCHRLGNAVGDVPYHLGRVRDAVDSEGADLAARLESSLSLVEHRVNSLADLRTSLEALARLERVTFEPVDLRQAVRDALSRALPCREIASDVDLPVAPVWVEGSRSLLCDALQSVIENACEAMAEGGRLQVRVLQQPGERRVQVQVADNGHGIADDVLPRIFELGFSTRTADGGGRGRGLFTCRAIVRKHRGEITVESRAGQGTTVVVSLPVMA